MQKNKKQKALCFLLLFSLAFAGIAFGTYFLFLRYGKSFIWNYDGIKQHYAALCYLGKYYREIVSGFLAGDFVLPMFDFSLGMGEDIITTLNFYGLGDPLTLLAALVPEQKTEYLYNFLVIFRIYLAGLSFAWFCREKGRTYSCTFIGALVYAFSGYVLHVAVKHPFFVIPMIFLPLAVIGVDRVLEKKKFTLLILVVFLTALNGFYFFYMNTLFLVVYALVRVICRNVAGEPGAALPSQERKSRFSISALFRDLVISAGRCLAAYGVGTAMAGVIFVPSIAAYLTSTRSESAFDAGNLFFFDADRYNAILTRLIGPPRITWDYLGMVSLVLFAIALLFVAARGKNRVLKVNIIIWTVMMLIPFGGYMMNGFSYVSGRFMYLVTFVYAVGLVYGLPELFRLNRKKVYVCYGVMMGYLMLVLFSSDVDKFYGWFGFIMLAITFLVIFSARYAYFAEKLTRKKVYVVLAGVVALNIIGNGWLLFGGKGQGYLESFVDSGTAYETIADSPEAEAPETGMSGEKGAEFWRVDAQEKSTENTGMITGRYGVSSYFSISNPNRIQYLLQMEDGGVLDSMFKIEGLDDRTYLEALASVRYYAVEAGKGDEVPYGYELVKEFGRGKKTYELYENTCFLPLGITYDSYMTEGDMNPETKENGLKLQEMMLKTVVLNADLSREENGKECSSGLEKIPRLAETPASNSRELPFEILETKHVEIKDGKAVVGKNGGSITLQVKENVKESELYVELDGFQITRKNRTYCDITVKCGSRKKTMRALTNQWNWYFDRDKYSFNLGLIDEKEMTLTIKFQYGGKFDWEGLKVCAQGMEDYIQTVSERKADAMEKVSLEKNRVSGRVSLPENRLLFLSIPYSEGWKAKVDGKEVAVYRANTAYMAVAVGAGDHEVVLTYETPYLKLGAAFSLAGILAFVIYEIVVRRRTSAEKKENFEKEKSSGVSV